MSDQSKPVTIDEALESIASGWRGWTFDQLDGTSFIKGELDTIDKTVAEAKLAINKIVMDIVKPKFIELKDGKIANEIQMMAQKDKITYQMERAHQYGLGE